MREDGLARGTSDTSDDDEGHERLLAMHRLDRRALPITLALGQSCFARKLWREASRYLGSLAEHPDAPQHAAEVAAGLALAGQADVRALRPGEAIKRYEAAVELDPNCASAWHALAQIAIERGELTRAAECLEREALATANPEHRLRLFDALGDLAVDVMHDQVLAERCWIQVADGNAAILDKLLVVQREHIGHCERAETCRRLAALDSGRRKELLQEATDAFVAGGDLVRARATAEQLIAAYPLDVDAVTCASAMALAACDADTAAAWLGRALAAWKAAGERDPRHAELWRRLGDAERSRDHAVDAKAAYKRAIAVAPSSMAALAARRSVVDLAAMAGRPTGTSLRALVEAEQTPAEIVSLAHVLATSNQFEEARAMLELAVALGVELVASDQELYASHAPRPLADDEAYAAVLDDAERRELIADKADSPFDEVFDVLCEAAVLAAPDPTTALCLAGMGEATRVAMTSYGAASAIYPQIGNALGGPLAVLYTSDTLDDEVAVLLAKPPVIVFGAKLAAIRSAKGLIDNDAELRFKLGRIVELARPHRIFAAGTSANAFRLLVHGLWHAFGPASDAEVDDAVGNEAEHLRTALPLLTRRRMTDLLATITRETLDPDTYLAACNRAADRAGLLACGNVAEAVRLAGGPQAAAHLVRFAASAGYLVARRKLRNRNR